MVKIVSEFELRLAGGWLLVLVCSERKVLLADYLWLFVPREKYYWPVAIIWIFKVGFLRFKYDEYHYSAFISEFDPRIQS
jgi:hypothetical protein